MAPCVTDQTLGLESDGTEELRMPECVRIADRHEHTAEVIPVKYQAQLSAMAPSTETYSSVKVVTTIDQVFALDTCTICLFLSKDGEDSSEYRKVQYRPLLIKLFRP